MLSSGRRSRSSFAVFMRWFALLSAAALAALTAAGCGVAGIPSSDCSFKPSQCGGVAMSTLCPTGGACTVDAAPATCGPSSCTVEAMQKLTIPLDTVALGSAPDILFRVVGGTVLASNLHLTIDGKELVGMDDPASAPYFRVRWADASSAPKKLELSFTGAPGTNEVELHFDDVDCRMAERSACHGGGA
jgi:hypothetical protein